jgi:N-acetyl sugar amidotransferase
MGYKICERCIMDTSDPDIEFDAEGICNHCYRQIQWKNSEMNFSEKNKELKIVTDKIKIAGKNSNYDCLIGLSGGVDSSYVAYYVVKVLGLRPLAVHLDNGWNSEISVQNIKNTIDKLNIDLFTHVINWNEFKNMQRSFIKSGVVDIELLTDNAIMGVLFGQAKKHKIKYLITGMNRATEFYPLPISWRHNKYDVKNIKAIQKRFGTLKPKTFPYCGIGARIKRATPWGLKDFRLLDYIPYVKQDVIDILEKELGWKSYGAKHFESIFTKIYQVYILPKKFKFEKRRAHLSSLIWSNQISRNKALVEIDRSQVTPKELEEDLDYLLKKLNFTSEEFFGFMNEKPKSHFDYPNDQFWFDQVDKLHYVKVLYTKIFGN